MTANELKALVAAKRSEGQELLSIMFDNSLYAHFIKDHQFDDSNIKTVGGVDCVETELKIRSQVIGSQSIPMTTVHPTEMIQALMFVPADRWEEVSPRELRYNIK